MNLLYIATVALLLALGLVSRAQGSCGSAFCTINTSWDVQAAWAEPGARVDLRYEFIDQNQPRAGGNNVAVGQIPRHHDEVYTRNRNWLGTFDYTFSSDWGLSASMPLVDRSHLHIHNHHGQQIPESWDFRALGDLRLLARYRLASAESRDNASVGSAGINFGMKVPTGGINERNADGELAERSLQPGSGTTDALLGAYYSQVLPLKDLSWFAQGLVQAPLNSRQSFKPGRKVSLDAGLRYDATDVVSLIVQVNMLHRSRDSGANAEPEDSGGSSVHLSPGLSIAASNDVRIYGFLQAPIYQYVNGVQLVARKAAVLGVSVRF